MRQWTLGKTKQDLKTLVTQTPQTNFRSPDPLRLHMKLGFDLLGPAVLEKMFENVDRRMTDNGWMKEH